PRTDYLNHLKYWLDHSHAPDIRHGRHWMLTPPRQVSFVHAVQRPLEQPLGKLVLNRGVGDTFVFHTGFLVNHSRSTGHVDVEANWFEYLDIPTQPFPNDIPGDAIRPAKPQNGHAYQVAVEYGNDNTPVVRLKHEFGDTKHRRVTYTPVATT